MVDYISISSFFYRINIFLSPRRSGVRVWFFILNIYFPRQYDITLYFPGGCFSINIEHFQVMNKYFLTKFNNKFHLRLGVSIHLTSVLVLEKKNNIYYFHFLLYLIRIPKQFVLEEINTLQNSNEPTQFPSMILVS